MTTRLLITSLALVCATIAHGHSGTILPGEYNIRTTKSGDIASVITRLEKIPGVTDAELHGQIEHWRLYNIRLPLSTSSDEVDDVLEDAVADGLIEWHAPNESLLLDGVIDLDGQTGSLWVSGPGIDQVGFSDNQYALGQFDIGYSNSPHEMSKGQGVLVAVLDTGIDATHPALLGHVSDDGVNLVGEGGPDDVGDGALRGHGTYISGLITLVAPESKILPIKVLDSDGVGDHFTVATGINEAVTGGAHVIALALGANVPEPILTLEVAIDNALNHGAVVLAAIGNGLDSLGEQACHYPASHPGVIAVGASNHRDILAEFSNYHSALNVLAPGETAFQNGAPVPGQSVIGPLPEEQYAAASGTSLATAFAAGAAALARAQGVHWPDADAGVPIEGIGVTVMDYIMDSDTLITVEMNPPHMPVAIPRLDPNSALLNEEPAPRWGDLDSDGFTSGSDLALMLGAWGEPVPLGLIHRPDLNMDKEINGADLSLLLGYWSATGSP